jgi:hypothetical protein
VILIMKISDGNTNYKGNLVFKTLKSFGLIIILIVASLGTLRAQNSQPTQQAPQMPVQAGAPATQVAAQPSGPTAILRGHVADPTGAMIPGAKVTLTNSKGKTLGSGTADSSGSYEFDGLPQGSYIVLASAGGFAPFASKPIPVAAGQSKRVDIAMAIATDQQSVVVTDENPTVNVEAGGNTNAIVIKGADLDALSDDPDELSSELTALAGPAAGPNGGQIYIDGFTGGQLPPKSAIREIRINQNPFSAEFDHIGYGRIEILTKPGTDKLHGTFFVQGNDKVFNTGNPFDQNIQPYDRIQFNATMNGSLNKNASFYISAEDRDNHDVQVYTYYPVTFGSGVYTLSPTNTSGDLANPHNRFNISPRVDLQLGAKNTLTIRYQFYHDTQSGDISSTQLPSQSLTTTSNEQQLQISNSTIISDHIVNETRFQYIRDTSSQTPASTAPTLQINGDYTSGGASSQSQHDHQDHFELQNITTMSIGNQAIKFGTRLRDNRDANNTNSNFNGTFTFTQDPGTQNLSLTRLTYSQGPTSFTANVFDAAVYFQDDWKANKFLTLSGGLRWESENHIADHDDWAPRAAFAYALDGHKNNQTKTVLRAGYGFFYDRLQLANVLQATRLNGNPTTSVQEYQIVNPTCFSQTTLPTSGCGTANSSSATTIQISPTFHSPYMQQFGTSLERQLNKASTLTFTYLHSYGVHQLVTRDSNQPGGPNYDASLGFIDEYYPEAVFKQNQFMTSVNAKLSKNLTLRGFYNFQIVNTDSAGGTASNAYNLMQDYGRATFASRNMVFMMATYTGPWGISFNPFLIAQSGKPFNIVLGNDLNENGFFNSRPAYASDPATCSDTGDVSTPYGCFNTDPAAGYTPIPINMGNGPAAVALNLSISRTWGLGPKLDTANNDGTPKGQGSGGGRVGGMGGLGGFGGGPGGGRGGPGGPTQQTNHKYNLTLRAQALNLFNDIDYGTPVGTLGATEFNRSTNLAGNIFSSGAAARRIFLQATFSF